MFDQTIAYHCLVGERDLIGQWYIFEFHGNSWNLVEDDISRERREEFKKPRGLCAEVELSRKNGHRKRDYKGVPTTQDTHICYFSL